MSETLYDTIVIELQKENMPVASAKISTTDIKQLLKNHKLTIGEIVQDIVESLINNKP